MKSELQKLLTHSNMSSRFGLQCVWGMTKHKYLHNDDDTGHDLARPEQWWQTPTELHHSDRAAFCARGHVGLTVTVRAYKISKDKIKSDAATPQCGKVWRFTTKQEVVSRPGRTSSNLTWILQLWGFQTATGNVRQDTLSAFTSASTQIWV